MSRTFPVIFISYLLLLSPLLAQKGRGENSDGNELFEQGLYEEALIRYQNALEKSPDSPIITFNSGDAQYKLEAFDRALEAFQQTLSSEDSRLKAHSFYNLANAQYRSGDLQEAVESYKEALRLDPDDPDTKHNLEFVLKELEENPPPQQDQNQNQENQDQDEEDQSDEQQQDKGDQDQSQQDQQPDESESEENQEEQQQNEGEREENEKEQPNPSQENQPGEQEENEQQSQQPDQESGTPEEIPMTREQANQILEALKEDQRDLLRMRTIKRKPAAGGKDW